MKRARFVFAAVLAQPFLLLLLLAVGAFPAWAQTGAGLSGMITDQTGATLRDVAVTIKNVDTGMIRNTTTGDSGRFQVLSLPVGNYEVAVSKQGFAETTRTGVRLDVGKDADVVIRLALSGEKQQVVVHADASIVNAQTRDTPGLVGEEEIKALPLNGRSFDLLLDLNPGIVNFTFLKTGGTGVSNSSTGNNFSVSGNRPQQNLFLLNGVEFTGAAENNMQPGGPSGNLMGVEAVREFNVLRDTYGAEYGKRPGAQVVIVTESGTSSLHGSVYEYLRNNDLDAPNYFDVASAPPFQRNEFGASLSGPIRKDKTFYFVNYEGLAQNLHQTSAAFVPDLTSRAAAVASVKPLLNLWPTPPANAPDFSGIAEVFSSPLQTIREHFGNARVDNIFSPRDTLSAIYTVDDGNDFTATIADPYSADVLTLREQVATLDETHIFSSALLNDAQIGYSRAGYFFTGEPTPGSPAAGVAGFLSGRPVGAVVVGGSAASNPQAAVGLAGSNNGSDLTIARNLYTYQDRVSLQHRAHLFSFGAWVQQFQSNETIALSQFGQATFTSLATFLTGTTSAFLYDPAPTEMNWRSLFAAVYAQDEIRIAPKLMVSLGFRAEFSNGWNEAHGRAANYTFPNGVISSTPNISKNAFTSNNEKFLPAPRVGLAWSAIPGKTVVRAGFGMYYELLDALGYRMDQNAPFNPVYSIASEPISSLPIATSAPMPAKALLVAGGVQPDARMPTLISYSLGIEQAITPNTSLTVRYVGSHGYHEFIGIDANEPVPTICPTSPCPAVYPGTFPAPLTGAPVPAGSYYIASGTAKANPSLANTWTWFSAGAANYNALQIDANHRFSQGFSLRGVYTWSKALDDGDSLNQTTANNAPGLVANPHDIRGDWGPATFNMKNIAVISAVYSLPFGKQQRFASQWRGFAGGAISGWSVTSIVDAQDGFPFTPQLSYNPSNNGDTRNPVRPFINPNFTGNPILGKPGQWFNPSAFLAPPANSGFYGNLRRNTLVGPGLADWDFSAVKDTTIKERLGLQFRAELFNLTNRANFGMPNLIVFTPSGLSGTAGAITSTSTTSRQVQFALRLHW